MEDLLRLAGLVVCAAVVIDLLRRYSPGYAILASLACCMVLLWMVADRLLPVLAILKTFTVGTDLTGLSCAFKAVMIALLSQTVQDLCCEAGQPALAGRVDLAGRILMLTAALPLFTRLGEILTALL